MKVDSVSWRLDASTSQAKRGLEGESGDSCSDDYVDREEVDYKDMGI